MNIEKITSFSIGETEFIIEGGGSGEGTTTGEGENSVIIGGSEGVKADGAYSLAGGTNDPELTKNLVWTDDNEPTLADPAQAIGAGSIAYGAGAIAHTAGSISMGTKSTAGAKGFYWYNSCEVPQFFEFNKIIDGKPSFYTFNYNGSETTILFEGVAAGDTIVIGTINQKIAHTFTSTSEEIPLSAIKGLLPCFVNTSSQYFKATMKNVPSKNIITLSLTQPRISYNPDGVGTLLEDGTWAQERTWSNEAQTLLGGWAPNEENYAIVSFYGGYSHFKCSKVLEVLNDGYIIVDQLPNPWESGYITTVKWDDYLIYCPDRPQYGIVETSLGSFAIGLETKASGAASFAQGRSTKANGKYSVATGRNTEAGYNAFAMGKDSKATGHYSMAGGYQSDATGGYSVALGHKSKATGEFSIALGSYAIAEGKYSVSLGRDNIASTEGQIVEGIRCKPGTEYVHIVGNSRTPNVYSNGYTLDWDGNGHFAGDVYVGSAEKGEGSKLATESFVTWSNLKDKPSIRSGAGSAALIVGPSGDNETCSANGKYSLAGGYKSVTSESGDQTLAFGNQCVASGNSAIALGRYAEAIHDYSTALGNCTITSAPSQTVLGKYNTANKDALFIVGNGKQGGPTSNAFEVNEDGSAKIAGSITMNGNKKLVTKTLKITYTDKTTQNIEMVVAE